MNIEMKMYKNDGGIKTLFSLAFVTLLIIVFIISIIDGVKHNDVVNIKYYIIVLVPLIYVMIYIFINYYGKIYLSEKNIYLEKIIFKRKIWYYEILEINEPNIITLKSIITLYPKDEYFWKEFNEYYLNYYSKNKEYFNETKELYTNLLEIKYELNEEIKQNTKIAPRRSLLAPLFIWLFFLNHYFKEREIYNEYSETKNMVNEHIKKYKNKPNFV
ncbi:hypothetical protein [Treponema primitia]|uniref:hypothetical protein n=1 Tax=Treponema primitia TaxID=88058 RepID=UPI0002555866|nr:hypothetical protein [Treponema primitia]